MSILLFSFAAAARAEQPILFPEPDRIFERLLADPRQVETSLHYYRHEGFDLSDVALGNGWGMFRWDMGDWRLQWNVEGMAYARFRLGGGINEFQTIDFFANSPFEVRRGKFSARTALYHESSHLGDDYIRRTGDQGFRYSLEGLRLIAAIEPHPLTRVYGGGSAVLHSVPGNQEGSLQAGFEARTDVFHQNTEHPWCLYLAQDVQWSGRVAWNPTSKTELGLRMARRGLVRALRWHAGYLTGHSYFGQFFAQKEHYFDLGVSFDF
ncbi:MAG: DUF1207 domain-containing protein [Elusimicrobiota bacterium]